MLAEGLVDLIAELMKGEAERSAADVDAAIGALCALVGVSRAAKLALLRCGFFPRLLSRIADLQGLYGLSRRAAAPARRRDACALPGPAPPGGGGEDPGGGASLDGGSPSADGGAGGVPDRCGALQRSLLCCVRLLSNALCGCEEAKLAAVSLQLPLLLQQLWAISRGAPALRRALMQLLCNYVAHCAPAKCSLIAYSDARGRCLIALLVRAALAEARPPAAPMALPLWQLHWRCLQSLATAAESRTVLLRSGCIGAAPSLAHRLLLGAKERDEPRAAAVLDFLANLAFDADGCTALLRCDGAFDALVEGLESRQPSARYAAALALRNVAFSSEGKTALLNRPRAMPALLGGLGPSDLRLSALSSAALWALLARSEKAKVAFRRGGLPAHRFAVAEKELAHLAMREPECASDPAALRAALRHFDAIARLLGADPGQLRA